MFALFFNPQITQITSPDMCELQLAKLTAQPPCSVTLRACCASLDEGRVQMLTGSGFVGHSCKGNSSPFCCFAVGLLHCALAASKSHWKKKKEQVKVVAQKNYSIGIMMSHINS